MRPTAEHTSSRSRKAELTLRPWPFVKAGAKTRKKPVACSKKASVRKAKTASTATVTAERARAVAGLTTAAKAKAEVAATRPRVARSGGAALLLPALPAAAATPAKAAVSPTARTVTRRKFASCFCVAAASLGADCRNTHPEGKEGSKTAAPAKSSDSEKSDGGKNKKKKKSKKKATPCNMTAGVFMTALACTLLPQVAQGHSTACAAAFPGPFVACPINNPHGLSVSWGDSETFCHEVHEDMFPTPNCFDRDRKYRHADRYRSLNKQEAEQRAVRRASDWASQIDSLTSIKAGSYLGSGQVAAAAPGACSSSSTSWLLDSGSGFDLVGKDEIDADRLPPKRQLKTPLEVETANGP